MAKASGKGKAQTVVQTAGEVVKDTAADMVRAVGTEVIQLPPSQIKWDHVTNVRPWEDAGDEKEKERIADLGKSIVREGQLQPIVVREIDTATGLEYWGIAGRRRTAAVEFANTTLKQKDLQVNCLVLRGVSDDDAFRKSLTENFRRLQMSAMDMALNVMEIRVRNKWDDPEVTPDWSKKVADFLKVSRAFVTQKVKLLEELDAEQQKAVHENVLSEEAALVIATKLKKDLAAAEKAAVLVRAKELAAQEKANAIATGTAPVQLAEPDGTLVGGEGQPAASEAATPIPATATATETGAATVVETGNLAASGSHAAVQERHVTAAAREQDALDKPEPLKRREILELFTQFDGPAYGHKNGDVRKFIACFEDCCRGTGKMVTFKKLWNKMTEKADEGTPEPAEEGKVKAKASGKK